MIIEKNGKPIIQKSLDKSLISGYNNYALVRKILVSPERTRQALVAPDGFFVHYDL